MAQQHTTTKFGFGLQSDKDVDPISATYYHLFRRQASIGNFPKTVFDIQANYYGSKDPTLSVVSQRTRFDVSGAAVNGIPWYLLLGSDSYSTGIHTLSTLEAGEKPFFVTRYQTENDTENIRKSVIGSKLQTLGVRLNHINENKQSPLMFSIGGMAIKQQDAAGGDLTPTYPGSVDDYFFATNSGFELSWDKDGDDVDIQPITRSFQSTHTVIADYMEVGELDPFQVLDGPHFHSLVLEMNRGSGKDIFDDFLAQVRSSNGKKLRLKIYSTATEYQQVDYNSVFVQEALMNDPNFQSKDDSTYNVPLIVSSISPTVKDGILANYSTFVGA